MHETSVKSHSAHLKSPVSFAELGLQEADAISRADIFFLQSVESVDHYDINAEHLQETVASAFRIKKEQKKNI